MDDVDRTLPEPMLVPWTSRPLTPEARAAASVYTRCEHRPMCATATYWAGIGRIVFALSAAARAVRAGCCS